MSEDVSSLEVHKLRRLGIRCATRGRIQDVSVPELIAAANGAGIPASELLPHRGLRVVDENTRLDSKGCSNRE